MSVTRFAMRAQRLMSALMLNGLALAVTLALAPAAATWPIVAVLTLALWALTRARTEPTAVQLLTWSRPATPAEATVLRPALACASPAAADSRVLLVRRRRDAAHPEVLAMGRRSLIASLGLMGAVAQGRTSTLEAAALMIHADAARRVEARGLDVALTAAMAPWRGVARVVEGVVFAFARSPLIRFAWRCRGWLAVIDAIQACTQGHAAARLGGTAVVLLTYLMPAVGRVLRVRRDVVADDAVVDAGLGEAFLGHLERAGTPLTSGRRRRLAQAAAPSRAPRRPALTVAFT